MSRFFMRAAAACVAAVGVLLAQAEQPKAVAKDADLGTVCGSLTTEVRLRTRGPHSAAELIAYLEPKQKVALVKKNRRAEVTQKRLQFRPRVLPIVVGTEVVFLNEDRVTHNVFIDSPCCGVDQDAKKGEQVTRQFAKAGAYPVVCRLHPEMKMNIVVLETPYFAACKWRKSKAKNERGKKFYEAKFEIAGVPPGKYTLRTWNQKLSPVAREVIVVAGKSVDVAVPISK